MKEKVSFLKIEALKIKLSLGGKKVMKKMKRMLHGGDYNPNQWEKEVWKEDMRIFKDAAINSDTINVF